MSANIKIVILDDHHIFLDAIRLLIESIDPSYEVHSFSSAQDVLRVIESGQKFDLILCDLVMNAMNGLAFLGALRSRTKTLPVIILSGINTLPPLGDVKRLGGNGFVHKSAYKEDFKNAIEIVLNGGFYFDDPHIAEVDFSGPSQTLDQPVSDHRSDLPELAPRQIEVLKLIANGYTNKEIARQLGISENTVKTHLKHIFREVGVNKRTACVRRAQALGLI